MGIMADLFESGLRAGLDFLSRSEKEESLPRGTQNLETAADVGLWLFRSPETRECLESLRQDLKELEAKYVQLEDMVNPFELRKALLERRCKHCPLP